MKLLFVAMLFVATHVQAERLFFPRIEGQILGLSHDQASRANIALRVRCSFSREFYNIFRNKPGNCGTHSKSAELEFDSGLINFEIPAHRYKTEFIPYVSKDYYYAQIHLSYQFPSGEQSVTTLFEENFERAKDSKSFVTSFWKQDSIHAIAVDKVEVSTAGLDRAYQLNADDLIEIWFELKNNLTGETLWSDHSSVSLIERRSTFVGPILFTLPMYGDHDPLTLTKSVRKLSNNTWQTIDRVEVGTKKQFISQDLRSLAKRGF